MLLSEPYDLESRGANVKVWVESKPKTASSDSERLNRIDNEILVDTYDEYEEISAWHCYLGDSISFPFKAVCVKNNDLFPLVKGDEVNVIKMADIDACYSGMFVMIQWMSRTFAVPLDLLEGIEPDSKTKEAIGDWVFWWNKR